MQRCGGLLIATLVLGMTLAGCSAPRTDPSPGPTGTTATGSAAPSTAPTATAAPTAATSTSSAPQPSRIAATTPSSGRTDPDAPKGQCADSALRISMREEGGGLENRRTDIVFTNTGSTSCTLEGAPGVSVVGRGSGQQLGRPADGAHPGGGVVRIRPGATAVAQLDRIYLDAKTTTFTSADGSGACDVEQGDGYRIYPPHSFRAVFVRRAGTFACTTRFVWMHVSSVRTP